MKKNSQVLQVPAQNLTEQYKVTVNEAIEEFRHLLVIKIFVVDTEATKISPTPLSKYDLNLESPFKIFAQLED